MSSLHRPPSIIAHVVWAVAFAVGFPASLAATRIRQITFDQGPQAAQAPGILVTRTGRGSPGAGGGIAPFLFRTFALGAFFVVPDERIGFDILYRAFGLDVLPKTPEQLALRKHRETWREAKASGDADRIRQTFFRLRRERFDMMGVRYEEEPMKEAPAAEAGGLDPRDVRVFFIPSKGSNSVVGKVYIAFNADPDEEPGVRERVEWATRWILARQVEAKVVEHCLEMPCILKRIYRDRSEGEHLLQWSRNEDGSSTLADAWDRRRPRFVTEAGMKPED